MTEGERSFNRDDFESTKVQKKKSVKKDKETKKLSKKELKLLEIKRELEREGEEEMKNGRRRDSFDDNTGNMGRNKNGLVHGMYEGEGEDFRCSQGEQSLIDSDGDGEEEEGGIDRGGLEMRTHWVAEVRTGNCREDGSSSSSSNTNLNISNANISGNVGGMSIEGTKGQKRRIRKKLDENEVSPHVQVKEEHKRRILNRYAVLESWSFSREKGREGFPLSDDKLTR